MKIEIITLHRITNFGSMLQTYATQTAVEKLGHKAEVIDFVPDGMTFWRGCWSNYRNNPTSLGAITALALYSAVCYSIVARGYLASALDNFVYVVCIPFWIAMIDNKYFNKKNR